jgi:type VI secretion system protein ImpL
MKKLLGFFTRGWLLPLLGLLALAILIWFIGPLFAFAGWAPLAGETVRWITIGVVFAAFVLYRLWRYLSARRKNSKMVENLAAAPEPAPDEAASASAEELATLRKRFEDALAVLKKTDIKHRLGGRYLYQLPWYVIIGPPGSGKSTALLHSGLNFPLAERFGQDEIRGVGGTRNCDWWFTEEAVLLDTAGRYATQDSFEAVDSAAWQGFLGMLKRYRPRRPINGALVAISLSDLMQQTETQRAIQARAIRQRVQELHQRLGIRFPVYVLFTKADLIAGFMEFFADLGKDERAQVWGMTFPLEEPGSAQQAIDHFSQELERLGQRLNQRLLDRLQQERDLHKRGLILAFPRQFAALKEAAAGFLNGVFQQSRFEEHTLVRGVYFTSGTQVGTPIDRIMNALASAFGLGRQAISAFAGSGRSYFVTRLLKDVVFREAGLAGTNLRLERQRQWVQRGAYAGAIGITALAALAWLTSYTRNHAYVQDVQRQAAAIATQVSEIPASKRDSIDILPVLNALRDIPGGYADRRKGTPWLMGMGLYQGDKLGSAAVTAYRRALKKALLPRIMLRMEDQIRQAMGQPDSLYEALRVYLMLDEPKHYDPDAVRTWVSRDWERSLPRDVSMEQRQQLLDHLDALLEDPQLTPLPLALDPDLVRRARDVLSRVPLADRIYSQLKQHGVSKSIPDFRITDAAGPDAALVFVRKSGLPLTQGIPALYTYAGYKDAFSMRSAHLIGSLAKESWVQGSRSQLAAGPEGIKALTDRVRDLYFDDYVKQWRDFLNDIGIVPLGGREHIDHAVEVMRVLSDLQSSPLRKLLEAAARETTLVRPGAKDATVTAKASQALDSIGHRVQRLFSHSGSVAPAAPGPEILVDHEFADLHAFVEAKKGQPAPIDRTLDKLTQLYAYLRSLQKAERRGQPWPGAVNGEGTQIQGVDDDAAQLPSPASAWLGTLAQDSRDIWSGGLRAKLNDLWTADVLPFCREAISGRYPLQAGSQREATLYDFGHLFSPGGLIDSFFQDNLKPIVDTTAENWRWRGGGLGMPESILEQFQRADAIKQAFFAGGTKLPSVSFRLTPTTLDADVLRFTLNLEGQIVKSLHTPPRIYPLLWPAPNSTGRVRLVFVDTQGGRHSMEKLGPWAWFRILDGRLRGTGQPDRFNVTFQVAGFSASFELQADSVLNPFRLPALKSFSCLERL